MAFFDRFRADAPLNVYKSAQLAHALTWNLREANMSDPAADAPTRFVVQRLR
jgi:hypothetical protein